MKNYLYIKGSIEENGYSADVNGNIWRRGKPISTYTSKTGYAQISLSYKGEQKTILVHQIVFVYFNNKACENINHIDGNKLNNNPSNLEESDRFRQMRHAHKLGLVKGLSRGESHYLAKLTAADVEKIRLMYASGKYLQREIAESFGVCRQSVGYIVNHKRWKHLT